MKFSLGVVHGHQTDAWFTHSLVALLTKKNPTEHVLDDHVFVRSGPLLSMGRGQLVGTFLETTDSDALVMLDDDMVFTPELFWSMLSTYAAVQDTYEQVGILAGVAFTSGTPRHERPMPNIYLQGPRPETLMQMSTFPENSLVEIGGVGCSNLIVNRAVLEGFAQQNVNPFHHVPVIDWRLLAQDIAAWDDVDKIEQTVKQAVWNADQYGEDLSFSMRVRDSGWKIFCHTGLIFDHSKNTLLGIPEYERALDAYRNAPPPNAPEATL